MQKFDPNWGLVVPSLSSQDQFLSDVQISVSPSLPPLLLLSLVSYTASYLETSVYSIGYSCGGGGV